MVTRIARKALKVYPALLAAAMALAMANSSPLTAQSPGGAGGQSEIGLIIHIDRPYTELVDTVQALGGTVTVQYQNTGAIAVRVPAGSVGRLLASPGITKVEKDRIVELPPALEENLEMRALPVERSQLLNAAGLARRIGEVPEAYESYISMVTGASDVWPETGAGVSSIVAVIDTGTEASHICLSGRGDAGVPASRVIAGPDFSPDVGTEFEGSTASSNNSHGTFVAGVIASSCFIVLDRRVPSDAALAAIFQAHLPPGTFFTMGQLLMVPLVGIAPASTIYAVKVFPHTGSGVATSIIEAALDHVITKKKRFNAGNPGGLDIDVVNMSLGGASLFDGRTLEERLVDAATEAGIVVVAAAGNDGPAPVSVSTPGTAFTALTAGAASDPVHTRIVWDIIFGPGQGEAMYPDDEFRPADFSGRGPLADQRASPDVLATGVFNLSLLPGGLTGFGSGTSFSAPAVAGGAALLSAWVEVNDPEAGPLAIRNAIIDGATPLPDDWKRRSQGGGYLNVAGALDLLKTGGVGDDLTPAELDEVLPNVTFRGGEFTTIISNLTPSRTVDLVFEIESSTSMVTIDLTSVDIDPNPVPAAIPNSIELYVKGAKRGGTGYIVYSANVFGRASVSIGDGFVGFAGSIFPFIVGRGPMEPGLMKVTVQGDWTNNGDVGARVTIRRFDNNEPKEARQQIIAGSLVLVPVEIPPGTTRAVLELGWQHNWARFPTNDLDMFLCAPGFVFFPDFRGATLNSPERIVLTSPAVGTWYVMVLGFGVFTEEDAYYLDVKLTVPEGSPPSRPSANQSFSHGIESIHNPDGHNEAVFKGESCF